MIDDEGGLSQAEQMIRRVSPEGRALARREARAKARSRNTVLLVAVAFVLVLAGMALVGAPPGAIGTVALLALLLPIILGLRARRQPVGAEALVATDLDRLPAQASAWLAAQRRALPAPAVQLTDTLARRLDELAPQLKRLPAEPAAEAVRKLIATELPNLVDGYRAVPASLRGQPRPDGRTPDAHLLDGLRLIDSEVARMTEQLARGAVDEVATQGRYLELKYRGDAPV